MIWWCHRPRLGGGDSSLRGPRHLQRLPGNEPVVRAGRREPDRHGLADAAAEMVHVCLSDAIAQGLASLGDVPIEVSDGLSLNALMETIERVADRLDN